MIKCEDCVVWVNPDDKVVRVTGAEVSHCYLRIQELVIGTTLLGQLTAGGSRRPTASGLGR